MFFRTSGDGFVRFADNRFDGCPPSLVATACLYVSVIGLKGIDWCNSVELAHKLHEATDIDQVCYKELVALLNLIICYTYVMFELQSFRVTNKLTKTKLQM